MKYTTLSFSGNKGAICVFTAKGDKYQYGLITSTNSSEIVAILKDLRIKDIEILAGVTDYVIEALRDNNFKLYASIKDRVLL